MSVRVLVLYWNPLRTEMRLSVREHLHVLDGCDAEILYHNTIESAPPWIAWTGPDLCILHTTFLCARWYDDFESYRRRFRWVSRLRCPKVALPQDEYNHAAVLDEWLLELDVSSVYSCFGAPEQATLYPSLHEQARFREALTGYIDEQSAPAVAGRLVPHADRPLDVVYRAKQLPYWFGSHGQLKHRVGEIVRVRAAELGLNTDISTRPEDTIYGDGWLDFLGSGRAVVGCESGSSVLDARGEIQQRIRRLLAERPDLSFEEVNAQMPAGWDSYAFFAISPRHLEAVVTKTAQVLVEGSYSGVLEPEQHYIPLRRDFANLNEALERLRDVAAVEEMAERAYREVYLSRRHSLQTLADQLLAEAVGRRPTGIAVPFALARGGSLPIRAPSDDGLLRKQIAHALTLAQALARQPEARKLLLAAVRGHLSTPLRKVAKEIVLLRVLARMNESGPLRGERSSLSIENAAGTIMIRTLLEPGDRQEVRLDGPFESVVWNHSAVGRAAPVFPRRPRWGRITLGPYGRYEFAAVAEVARTDAATARALLARALEE